MEVAFLLQRIQEYRGLVILATSSEKNVDLAVGDVGVNRDPLALRIQNERPWGHGDGDPHGGGEGEAPPGALFHHHKERFRPGVVAVVQTLEHRAHFRPHVHALVTRDGRFR